jgi:acetyltransferase-like isoleucine patch superfamily enzyme
MSETPSYKEIGVVDVDFGENVTVIKPVNLYGCKIGDDCFIGPFVEVQKNVKIGNRTRIQSHCFICELVTVGEDCFIGHGVMFINDWFETGRPARDNPELWVPTILGDRVSIGSNATILPVSICDDVVIGAGSVVTRDINIPGIYHGSPARLVRTHDEAPLRQKT